MKDYHINIFEDNKISVTKDINRKGVDYMLEDIDNAWKKRYILEVGSKVVDIFGNVVTIKEIIHHESTQTTNYLVEENGNTYCPREFAGVFVRFITKEELDNFLK